MDIQNNTTTNLHKKIPNNACRVCLTTSENNKCIYLLDTTNNDNDKSKIKIREILELHGGIELSENDGLPSNICQECILDVHTANKLWKQCQLTDQKLRAIHKKSERNRSRFNSLVNDQSCQTDLSFSLNENKYCEKTVESNTSKKLSVSIEKLPLNISNTTPKHENVDCEEHWCSKAQRTSIFKRATSINNLKNNKDRQRNYIKNRKSFTTKSDDQENLKASDVIDKNIKKLLTYKDPQSNQKYSNEKSLSNLSHITHNEKNNKSSLCSQQFVSITCIVCEKVFKKIKTMIKHLNIHKKTNPTQVYNILKQIRAEKKSGIPSNEQLIINNTLGNYTIKKLSDTEKPLDVKDKIKHINSWMKELFDSENESKKYRCATCEKFYSTKKSLLKHNRDLHDKKKIMNVQTETKTEEKLKHQCNKGNKIFNKELQLEKHSKIHDDDDDDDKNKNKTPENCEINFKRFLCHICSKTFRQNTGLMFHIRTHTGYKPHTCKHCGRGFTSNSNCINHERTHTGDRPFICHYCSAAFAKSCTLKSHITTHTGEANYHCKACGKSFKRLKYLKEHTFTHTGEKPYVCKICGSAYSHSGSLFVHKKKCQAQFNYPSVSRICHTQNNDDDDDGINSDLNSSVDLVSNKNYIGNVKNINAISINNSVNIESTVESLCF